MLFNQIIQQPAKEHGSAGGGVLWFLGSKRTDGLTMVILIAAKKQTSYVSDSIDNIRMTV